MKFARSFEPLDQRDDVVCIRIKVDRCHHTLFFFC